MESATLDMQSWLFQSSQSALKEDRNSQARNLKQLLTWYVHRQNWTKCKEMACVTTLSQNLHIDFIQAVVGALMNE